jgi:hypothetical protein
VAQGKYVHGELHERATFTTQQVIEIYQSSEKLEYLAAVYKCSVSAISNIRKGKTWSHVTKYLEKGGNKKARKPHKKRLW